MKKVLLFLFVSTSLFFSSCNNDDDSPNVDALIGKWKVIQEFENDQEIELDCSSQGILEFKSDFTFTIEEFEENSEENCILVEVLDGVWLKNSNGTYTVTTSDDFSTTVNVVFGDQDTFSVTEIDGDFTNTTVYQRQ